MEQNTFTPQEEKEIRKTSKKRVGFKIHSAIYMLVCILFWLLWIFIFKNSSDHDLRWAVLKFCLFVTLTWGIGIISHYLIVYKWNKTLIEKEIERLKKEIEQKRQYLEEN